jgi:hypothetical protein
MQVTYIFYPSSSSNGTTTFSWISAWSTIVEHSQHDGFYRVPLPAARPTPNLEENQRFRAFQLSPQEAPSVWSDASEPSSWRWNYGREMAEKFCRKWRLPRHFWVLLHAVKQDMGRTALLLLRRKACWGFFARKIRRLRPGLNPRTCLPKANTLPLDHRSRYIFYSKTLNTASKILFFEDKRPHDKPTWNSTQSLFYLYIGSKNYWYIYFNVFQKVTY